MTKSPHPSRTVIAAISGACVLIAVPGVGVAARAEQARPSSKASVFDPRDDLKSYPKPKRAQKVDSVAAYGKASQGPDILSARYDNGRDRLRVTVRLTNVKWASEIAIFARAPGRGPLAIHQIVFFRELLESGATGYKDFTIDDKRACPAANARVLRKVNAIRVEVPRECIDWSDELTFSAESRRYYEYLDMEPGDPNGVMIVQRRYVWQRDTTKQTSATTRG